MKITLRTQALLFVLTAFTPVRPALSQTLSGAIDIHAHCDPDGTPRSIDAIDLARLAKSRGMRAIVLKNHYEPTASLAYIVRKEVPGIEVFGGISLDLTNGGVNPAAVEWMTKVKGGYGRVVWMPTYEFRTSGHFIKPAASVRPRCQRREAGAGGSAGDFHCREEQLGAGNRTLVAGRSPAPHSRGPAPGRPDHPSDT